MTERNPALEARKGEMLAAVRDTITNLVFHHFPDAKPNRRSYTGNPGFIGIDATPSGDEHAVVYAVPVKGYEDMYPDAQLFLFTLPDRHYPDGRLLESTVEEKADLQKDINRLLTGREEGETFPCVYMIKDGERHSAPRQRVAVFLGNADHRELTVIVYGTAQELHARMQKNLIRHQDIRAFVPNSGQARNP